MRFLRNLPIALALTASALIIPASAHAQRQGAIEIGGFGRFTKFMDTLQLDNGLGLGARGGMYVFRNWLLEAELSYADVDVTAPLTGQSGLDSLNKVSHALWAYRLTYNMPMSDRAKLLIGGGYAYDSYGRVRRVAPRGGGPQGLLGLRLILNDRLSLRFEGTGTYVMPEDEDARPVARQAGLNLGAQGGLSVSFFTRPPAPRIQYDTVTITRVQRDTQFITRIDTVRAGPATGAGSAVRPVVIGAINFAFNKSDITDEAKRILDRIAESLTDPTNAHGPSTSPATPTRSAAKGTTRSSGRIVPIRPRPTSSRRAWPSRASMHGRPVNPILSPRTTPTTDGRRIGECSSC